ncbi:MAG: pyridoxamine kinase [Acutalibacteraceae bacterium]|nr:pyridoxamine kinase [Acutalibacteraceae bacterium]
MKRIITIQDISCVGKCSLTVALPIISACKVETAVLPTAVLSNHTAFSSFSFCDLTSEIAPISEQFEKQGFDFDAIYTGYLGSFEQLDLVGDFFKKFKKRDNLIIVDPVMGDNGKLYSGFDEKFAKSMKKLCDSADIIMPNLTEACFMLGTEYKEDYDEKYIKDILVELTQGGCKCALITGVSFDKNALGVYGLDKVGNRYFSYFNKKISAAFHGTGDCFASALTGALMRDKSIDEAVKIAADFTAGSIEATTSDENSRRYGVNFEEMLPSLIEAVK